MIGFARVTNTLPASTLRNAASTARDRG